MKGNQINTPKGVMTLLNKAEGKYNSAVYVCKDRKGKRHVFFADELKSVL